MGNRNYARGAAFERKVKEYYEALGYYALRAAGSHGLTDVIAISEDGHIHFIQCKTGKGRMSRADRAALLIIARRYGAEPILATDKDGITFEIVKETT